MRCPNDDSGKCTLGAHTGDHGYIDDDTGVYVRFGPPVPVPPKRSQSRKEFTKKVQPIADATRPATKTGAPMPAEAFRRNSDPETSHRGIEEYEPYLDTVKGRVIDLMVRNLGTWLTSEHFDTIKNNSGGRVTSSERRMRQLRQEADEKDLWYRIESETIRGAHGKARHRLVERSSNPGPV